MMEIIDTTEIRSHTQNNTEKLDGQKLRVIYEKFSLAWSEKMLTQRNVPIFSDHIIKTVLTRFSMNVDAIPWEKDLEAVLSFMEGFAPREEIETFISQMVNWYYGRYVSYDMRVKPNEKIESSVDLDFLKKSDRDSSFILSQGRFECLKWKDIILFKTVHDLAVTQMLLWELKPKTIIEIGSGTGGGAIWMADLMASYGIKSNIISFDLVKPSIKYDSVTFLKGDCNEIEKYMKPKVLEKLPHPWMIVEDAHVNVYGVLKYFHSFMKEGDYLIVEDSDIKQEEISHFIQDTDESYLVDAKYCDFFGRNMTCSYDSIFRKTK